MEIVQARLAESSAGDDSLSGDPLANLEQRISRAVHLIIDLRTQNAAFAKRVAALEEEVNGASAIQHQLEANNAGLLKERDDLALKVKQHGNEMETIQGEREEVRTRIEKLLTQLDLLSAS